jgi:xylan 1,4-beta-xylosidase
MLFTPKAPKTTANDEFKTATLDPNWNTLRVPFSEKMGTTGEGKLTLVGQGSLANTHDLADCAALAGFLF